MDIGRGVDGGWRIGAALAATGALARGSAAWAADAAAEAAPALAQAVEDAHAAPNLTDRMAYLALQLGVILIAAKFGGFFARKINMPPVLGELLAGVAVGPFALGALPVPFLHLGGGLFPAVLADAGMPVSAELYGFATMGSIILLFVSGLETDLGQFLRYSVAGSVVGLGGVIASFAAGAGAGVAFIPDASGFMDPRCLFLGVLSTATSVGITARILSDKKKMDSPEGVTIMAAAVIDDVLGIIGLAIVGNLTAGAAMAAGPAAEQHVDWAAIARTTAWAFGVWIGATVFCLVFANRFAAMLKRFRDPINFATMAAALAFIAGGLIEQAGLAMIIGAYVLGLSLSKTDIAFALQERMHSLYALFVPLFFAVMGMLVNLESFAKWDVLKFGLVFSAAAVLAKIVGCALPALALNFNPLGALRIGIGMVPRGEVALIIAGIGATKTMLHVNGEIGPILDADHFGAAIIMTLVTTVVAPPLLSAVMGGSRPGLKRAAPAPEVVETPFLLPTARLTEMVFDKLVSLYRTEGYFVSRLNGGEREYRMAKERSIFTLVYHDTQLRFTSMPSELPFIQFSVTEAVADLRQSLEFLHQYVAPAPFEDDASATLAPNVPDALMAAPGKGDPLPGLASYVGTVLREDCIVRRLHAKTNDEAIRELVGVLATRHRLGDPARVLVTVREREVVSPTGLERGLALPHARTDAVHETVAAVGLSEHGLDFGARDGVPARLIVLVVSPRTNTSPHLAFITALALRMKQIEDVRDLLNAETPLDILGRLAGGEPMKSRHRIWQRLHGANPPPQA